MSFRRYICTRKKIIRSYPFSIWVLYPLYKHSQVKHIKPLRPTQREKQRYLTYAVWSETSLPHAEIKQTVDTALLDFMGELNYGKAGIQFVEQTSRGGIIRMNRDAVDLVKAGIMMINTIQKNRVVLTSSTVSGMLHKARHAEQQ